MPLPDAYTAEAAGAPAAPPPASSRSSGDPVTTTGALKSTAISIEAPAPYAPSALSDLTPTTDGGSQAMRMSELADSEPGAPGAGSEMSALLPLPSMMAAPLSRSAPPGAYPRRGVESPGSTAYRNVSVRLPDPERYAAALAPPEAPVSRSSAGAPPEASTVTGSVNDTAMYKTSSTFAVVRFGGWAHTRSTRGGSRSWSNIWTRSLYASAAYMRPEGPTATPAKS